MSKDFESKAASATVNNAEKFIDFIVAANSGVAVVNSTKQLSLLWHFYTFKGRSPQNGFLVKDAARIADLTALKNSTLWREVTDADIAAAAEIPPPKFLTDELIARALAACGEAEDIEIVSGEIRDKTTGEVYGTF